SQYSGLPTASGLPALNVLQEVNTFPVDYAPYMTDGFAIDGPFDTILKDTTLRLSGPTITLPAGALNISALIEHREEKMQGGHLYYRNGPVYYVYPGKSQNADSFYLEANLPLVTRVNALPLLKQLEVQASVRHDRYETRSFRSTGAIEIPAPDAPYPTPNYSA